MGANGGLERWKVNFRKYFRRTKINDLKKLYKLLRGKHLTRRDIYEMVKSRVSYLYIEKENLNTFLSK